MPLCLSYAHTFYHILHSVWSMDTVHNTQRHTFLWGILTKAKEQGENMIISLVRISWSRDKIASLLLLVKVCGTGWTPSKKSRFKSSESQNILDVFWLEDEKHSALQESLRVNKCGGMEPQEGHRIWNQTDLMSLIKLFNFWYSVSSCINVDNKAYRIKCLWESTEIYAK